MHEYPLEELKNFADGMNIEGGSIAKDYLHPHQIFTNLCVVMDRPFIDGVEFKEIKARNSYPLKETSVLEYNEPQVNFAYIEILSYYLKNAHRIAGKKERVNILLQVHRKSSGPKHLELLETMLSTCYPELKKKRVDDSFPYELFSYFFPDLNVRVRFCFGDDPKILGEAKKYQEADIILSYSLGGGLNPKLSAGAILVPKKWIPFSIHDMTLCEDEAYFTKNHLEIALEEILQHQSLTTLEIVNRKFCSENPSKKDLAKLLTREDFLLATIVQAAHVLNPSELSSTFRRR